MANEISETPNIPSSAITPKRRWETPQVIVASISKDTHSGGPTLGETATASWAPFS